MSLFDADVALKVLGLGGSPINALGMSFGVPNCIVEFTKGLLTLLPSDLVASIATDVQAGRDSASEVVAEAKRSLIDKFGIIEIDTEKGTFSFISNSSKNGLESNTEDKVSSLLGFTQSVAFAVQTGAEIYTSTTGALQIINSEIDCFNTYLDFLKASQDQAVGTLATLPGGSADLDALFLVEKAKVQTANAFISMANDLIRSAGEVLNERAQDPSLEPLFNPAVLPPGYNPLTASSLNVLASDDPVFRLTFGPPLSKSGQFLLSVDGLYYDSQSGGLPEVSGIILPEDVYKFEYDANLGGKGQAISLKKLNEFVDTVFDLTKISETPAIKLHYDADTFLQELIGQKHKQIDDDRQEVDALLAGAYTGQSAIVVNLRQALISTEAVWASKINRRKKQIEVAITSPQIFGASGGFPLGEVPINDFSYLSDLNLGLAFAQQEKLIFKQGEVSGVVLPLQPKFVKATQSAGPSFSPAHLSVPSVGPGSILFNTSAGATENDIQVLSLTDQLSTDGIVAAYSFLQSTTVADNASTFSVLNSFGINKYNNAQLVSDSASDVFTQGLGIPYLDGVNSNYVRLPDTPEFQNLTYNLSGFTMDTWVKMPTIGTAWDPGLFSRLILSCENTGGLVENITPTQATFSDSIEIVKGMMIGFSRDRRISNGLDPSDIETENTIDQAVFFVAPTRSVNGDDVTFLNTATTGCASGFDIRKCAVKLDTVVEGKSFNDASGAFMHVVVSMNVVKDTVSIYLDSTLMATSSLSSTFGTKLGVPPQVPSFLASGSYNASASGPSLNPFFTPWIVGGGYTDSYSSGGFMGINHGTESGLQGHLGSLKFYNRPLTSTEVIKHYKAQKGFFKNIVFV